MTFLGLELKSLIWRFLYKSFKIMSTFQNTAHYSLTSIDSVLDSSKSERYHISLVFPKWTAYRSTNRSLTSS